MAESFMQRPTEVYLEWLHKVEHRRRTYEDGRMAMALEIITTRKSLMAVGMLSAERVSVLDTLLADQGLLDESDALYDELSEWRKTKLHDVSGSSLSRRRRTLARVSTPPWLGRGRKIPPSDEPEGPTT